MKLKAFQETGEGNNVIRIYAVWGLKLQDRTKCHFTDYKCKGETVFDEEFDMNQPKCQEAVLVCLWITITVFLYKCMHKQLSYFV